MKKILFAFTASLLISVSATFATEVNSVPKAIEKALLKEFKDVKNLEWKTTNAFYKASFLTDGRAMEAFYSLQGKFIGVSRKLTIEQLPMSLSKEAKEKATSGQIFDIFEMLTDRGTEFYITISNNKETQTFKSIGTSWYRL